MANVLTRVKNFIAAGVSNFVENIEKASPEALYTMALTEVDGLLSETRAELGKIIAENISLSKKLEGMNTEMTKLETQVVTAVKENRDDLAKVAISRKFDLKDQIPVIQQKVAENLESKLEFEGSIKALLAKKREIMDQKGLVVNKETPQAQIAEKVQFGERLEYVEELIGKTRNVTMIDGVKVDDKANLIELQELQHASDVNAELESIKKQITKD